MTRESEGWDADGASIGRGLACSATSSLVTWLDARRPHRPSTPPASKGGLHHDPSTNPAAYVRDAIVWMTRMRPEHRARRSRSTGSASAGKEDDKVLAFGSHTSAAGGCDQAIVRAMELGVESCQLFTKNERQWVAKPLDPAVIERFHAKVVESGFDGRLVAHDSYLINIASPDDALRERSRLALREELDRCDQLGIPYLVSHPGAHVGSGVEAGMGRVAESINRIHAERADGKAMLLLETTAGQGTTLGR